MEWADRGEPGCAVGVIEDGELVLGAGFGVEDLTGRQPITVESRFDIASEAKQVTAAGDGRFVCSRCAGGDVCAAREGASVRGRKRLSRMLVPLVRRARTRLPLLFGARPGPLDERTVWRHVGRSGAGSRNAPARAAE